jgi:hypothetical protein
MARYVRKFGRIGHALGPSEERGFALWVGYDIESPPADPAHLGFIAVDDWPQEKIDELGVKSFVIVRAHDQDLRRKLGLQLAESKE